MALEDEFGFGFTQKKQSRGKSSPISDSFAGFDMGNWLPVKSSKPDSDDAVWGDMLGDTLRGAGKVIKRIAKNTVSESDKIGFKRK